MSDTIEILGGKKGARPIRHQLSYCIFFMTKIGNLFTKKSTQCVSVLCECNNKDLFTIEIINLFTILTLLQNAKKCL